MEELWILALTTQLESEGHPFKYNPNLPYDHSWERLAGVYGGFGSMKDLQLATCACFKKLGPFYGTSVTKDIIRL